MAREKSLSAWFKHDSNAKDDFKCMLIIEQLGCEGYGIFWILVEILRDQKDYRYPLSLVGALARKYNTTEAKILTVVREYGLFKLDKHSFFFSNSLNRRMKAFDEIIEKRKFAGEKSGEARRQKATQHQLNTCLTSVQLLDNKKEEKRRKLYELKEQIFSKSTQALSDLFSSGAYKALFLEKIISKIEMDQGFSNLKTILENNQYDDWVMEKLL